MSNIPMVKMLYTSAAIEDFPIKDILSGKRKLTVDDYLPIFQIPIMEMISKEPLNTMEELLAMTASAEWKERLRRSPECGDIMVFGIEYWMLVKKADLKYLILDTVHIVLPERKTYAIVLIPPSQVNGDICNPILQTT